MIQAFLRPDIWGLYDQLPEESTLDMTSYEERVRCDIFHEFGLNSIPYCQQCKDRENSAIGSIERTSFHCRLENSSQPTFLCASNEACLLHLSR
jgi:hypothetical protein